MGWDVVGREGFAKLSPRGRRPKKKQGEEERKDDRTRRKEMQSAQ